MQQIFGVVFLHTQTTCLNVRQNRSQKELQPNSGRCAISACTLLTQRACLQARMCKKTQFSDVDKTILSGTEKSVAMKYEESEDPTLIHVLRAKSLQNMSKILTRPRFISSLSIKLSGEFYVHLCMCATVHLSADDVKRIDQNVEVPKVQTVFETVQAQSSNLRLRDQEIDWTDGHWRFVN